MTTGKELARLATEATIDAATREANEGKERLMRIQRNLEAVGATRKARTLGTIIERLERWQNTP